MQLENGQLPAKEDGAEERVEATERNVEWMEQMVARAKVNRILLTTLT